MTVDAAVVALAVHPARELPASPGTEKIEQDGVLFIFFSTPNALLVEPLELEPVGVPVAVAEARRAARERGKRLLAWWIAPENARLGSALEREGLVNADAPGMEAVETAMVLVRPPVGESRPEIAVSSVESFEDFTAARTVSMEVFKFPEAMRAEAISELPQRWNEYTQPENPGRSYIARIGNEVVGTAGAVFGDAGINLVGGAVLPQARGRGIYRALTMARWEEAVKLGKPALTVQAGRMSMPILAKLGFTPVGEIRTYADDIKGAETAH